MQITNRRIGNAVVLSPSGRIDHASAEGFKEAILPHVAQCRAGGDVVVLDFTGVDYISSVGLRVLMVASKAAKTHGRTLAVCGLQPVVREIFEISRFNLVLKVFPALREALTAVSPAALAAFEAA